MLSAKEYWRDPLDEKAKRHQAGIRQVVERWRQRFIIQADCRGEVTVPGEDVWYLCEHVGTGDRHPTAVLDRWRQRFMVQSDCPEETTVPGEDVWELLCA